MVEGKVWQVRLGHSKYASRNAAIRFWVQCISRIKSNRLLEFSIWEGVRHFV